MKSRFSFFKKNTIEKECPSIPSTPDKTTETFDIHLKRHFNNGIDDVVEAAYFLGQCAEYARENKRQGPLCKDSFAEFMAAYDQCKLPLRNLKKEEKELKRQAEDIPLGPKPRLS